MEETITLCVTKQNIITPCGVLKQQNKSSKKTHDVQK